MRGRSRIRGLVVALCLALAAGCSGRPPSQDVEPAMQQAVRTVVGDTSAVRRELRARCGPTDELLDGRRLVLLADVPAGSVDLEDVAHDLRRTGLDVEVGDGTGAPLLAVGSGDGWSADLWPSTDGPGTDRPWRLTATAEVVGAAGGAVLPCG